MRLLALLVLALILFVVATVFASLNDQQLALHYFLGQIQISLPLLLLLVFLLGALIATLLSLLWVWRLRWQNFRLKAQLLRRERDLSRLHPSTAEKSVHV